MEYVAGEPITQFCDDNKPVDRRAAGAVHAGLRRDRSTRTPRRSSIATSSRRTCWRICRTASRSVKVIDFGIAKATHRRRLTDHTFNTERGQLIGTYDSMSPEQADGLAGHRHAHRCLLAGRAALRAADRRQAVRSRRRCRDGATRRSSGSSAKSIRRARARGSRSLAQPERRSSPSDGKRSSTRWRRSFAASWNGSR